MASNTRSSNRRRASAEAVAKRLETLVAADLPGFLQRQRWFGSKGRRLRSVSLLDHGATGEACGPWWLLVEVQFEGDPPEIYSVPLAARAAEPEDARLVGHLDVEGQSMAVYDAFDDREFCLELLDSFEHGRTFATQKGIVRFMRTSAFPALLSPEIRAPQRISSEQSNTSVVYGGALILKGFRKIEPGINPDCEVTGFLTTRTQFRNVPLLAGAMEYSDHAGVGATFAMLQHFIPNQGDGWTFALDHLKSFCAFIAKRLAPEPWEQRRMSQLVREFSAGFFVALRRLGSLTGALHAALASDTSDPAFAPEPIDGDDVSGWTVGMTSNARLALAQMRHQLSALPKPTRDEADMVLSREDALLERAGSLELLALERCVKIRIHGDYHLGQTLRAGDDFAIFDFEGEPARPLPERRANACPLKDVAGMLRSFHYAVAAAMRDCAGRDSEMAESLEAWGESWWRIATNTFLEGYLAEAAHAPVRLLPASRSAFDAALTVYELDKALYELCYEINNRPVWLPIPLAGLTRILSEPSRPDRGT